MATLCEWSRPVRMGPSLRLVFSAQDETVEKSCDKCGAKDVSHRVHHVIRRLPRVLVLHLKRFQVNRRSACGCTFTQEAWQP